LLYFFDKLIIYMPALNSLDTISMFHPLKKYIVTADLQTKFHIPRYKHNSQPTMRNSIFPDISNKY